MAARSTAPVVIALVALVPVLAGCADSPITPEPPVASVSVTLSAATLTVGQEAQAVAVLRDAGGNQLSDRSIDWSSSDPLVATVSGTGLVTAVAPGGPVSITAIVESKSGSALLSVTLAPVASIEVTLAAPTLTVSQESDATAVLRDANGTKLPGRPVTWATSDETVASISQTGHVTALGTGWATITASAEGIDGNALITVVTADELLAGAIDRMLQQVPDHIAWALGYNEDLLPTNPGLAAQIQAKIALLQGPALATEIVDGGLYFGTLIGSLSGGWVPLVTVFPADTMRTGAVEAVSTLTLALPILETFFARPIFEGRDQTIRVWYGFTMGNTGGGGTINTEDRGTYEARTSASRLPHEAILDHELSHSYVGHESLTQYLELYIYNMAHTNSTSVASWIFTRGYSPFAATNDGVHALLDVHQLIGWQGMVNAYRVIYPLYPPYGVPLCEACKQAFVDQAPADVKAQVADIVARITF